MNNTGWNRVSAFPYFLMKISAQFPSDLVAKASNTSHAQDAVEGSGGKVCWMENCCGIIPYVKNGKPETSFPL